MNQNIQADGVYSQVAATPTINPQLLPNEGLYVIVGGANDGEPDQLAYFFDPGTDGQAQFGNDTTSANSLMRAAYSASGEQNPAPPLFGGVRRVDGTDQAATITVQCAGLQAFATFGIGGTPQHNDTVAVALNPGAGWVTVANYTVQTGQGAAAVAVRVAAQINASTVVSGNSPFLDRAMADVDNDSVYLGALAVGTGGNSYGVRVKATGGHTTITAVSPTFAGGAAKAGNSFVLTRKCSGSRANLATAIVTLQSGRWFYRPTVGATVTYPNAPPEQYNGIQAWAGGGSNGFDKTTFLANLLAQVNGSLANVAGSPRWTATGSSGTQPPVQTSTQATGGTDGTSGLSDTDLGSDGVTGKTGLYVLRDQIAGAQFGIAGLTDPSVAQTLQQFASEENAIALYSYPAGTQTQDAQDTRAAYNVQGDSLITTMDWDSVFDVVSGTQMLVPPQDKIAGLIASLPPEVYPGNQPIGGVSGIDSTDHIIGGVNTVIGEEPAIREASGLLYLGYMPRSPRGPALGLPHGMMSDGVTVISDARMLKYIVATLQVRFGAVVGEAMNTDPGSPDFLNPAAKDLRDIADAFLGGLKNGKRITAYRFLLGSDNTQATSQRGFLMPRTLVTTNSPAQFIINTASVGRTVQVTFQPA